MTGSLAEFVASWDAQYRRAADEVEMFKPGVPESWSASQRHVFVRSLYHVNRHFGDFLWHLGSVAPTAEWKELILDNLRDEFGGGGASHETLYLDLARAVGVDLRAERFDDSLYPKFLRDYNRAQVIAVCEYSWEETLAGFAAGERLDYTDYLYLDSIFRALGAEGDAMTYVSSHTDADHFTGVMKPLEELWARDPELVGRVFDQVLYFQLMMWREVSDHVCKGREEQQADSDDGNIDEGELRETPQSHYAPARYPCLVSKYADLVAFDRGDASAMRLDYGPRLAERVAETKAYREWGSGVLLFGANGFVGAHLLDELLRDERVGRVFAVARSRRQQSPRDRIAKQFETYALDPALLDSDRLRILDGALPLPRFGVGDPAFRELTDSVDTVFQCAGTTRYTVPYPELRAKWVLGFFGVLQFAMTGRPKQVTYMGSTISHLFRDPADFQRPDTFWFSGYAQMKWANQNVMADAAARGLRMHVCEAPYVIGSTTAGIDPGYYQLWRALDVGMALKLLWDGEAPAVVPVDVLTKALLLNALAPVSLPVVRPTTQEPQYLADIAAIVNCRVTSWEGFRRELQRFATDSEMKLLPEETPDLIRRTNLPPIYPPRFDQSIYPPAEELVRFYLKQARIA